MLRWAAGAFMASSTLVVLVLPSVFPASPHPCYSAVFPSPPHSLSLSSLPLTTPSPTRGPGDVIGDCKVQFLDEIYQVEKPGSRALSAADGQFKRT